MLDQNSIFHQNLYWAYGLISFLFVAGFVFIILGLRTKRPHLPAISAVPEKKRVVEISWNDRLKKGLERSRKDVWGKIFDLFSSETLTDDQMMELEEILYSADIGAKLVQELLSHVLMKAKGTALSSEQIKKELYFFMENKLDKVQKNNDRDLFLFDNSLPKKTKVIMIVGVNGVGKTTTIGKLATKLTAQGANVVVGACDTFRAAAVDQLQIWCDRAGAKMVRAKENSAPSGVGYQALEMALNLKADYCLLDTAGRLHNNENLMEELKKSKNVLKKLLPEAPHHALLVIDAITGQNALKQAMEFHKMLGLTGIILTKCDGSSKAGSALAIVDELKVPITYIGVGEDVSDLDLFKSKDYLNAMLGINID